MAKFHRDVPIPDLRAALTNVIQQHRDYSNEARNLACKMVVADKQTRCRNFIAISDFKYD